MAGRDCFTKNMDDGHNKPKELFHQTNKLEVDTEETLKQKQFESEIEQERKTVRIGTRELVEAGDVDAAVDSVKKAAAKDLYTPFSDGQTILMVLATKKRSNVQVAETIFEKLSEAKHQSFINAKHPVTGQTALHMSIEKSDTDFVALLLQKGARVDVTDGNGLDAMDLAAQSGGEILDLIILNYDLPEFTWDLQPHEEIETFSMKDAWQAVDLLKEKQAPISGLSFLQMEGAPLSTALSNADV